jgi:hypothetical protein
MSKMIDVDTLEAGRELDALIAKRVMGCNAILKDYKGNPELFCYCDDRDHEQPATYVRPSHRKSGRGFFY